MYFVIDSQMIINQHLKIHLLFIMRLRRSQLKNIVEKDHLYADRISYFDRSISKTEQQLPLPSQKFETNFGITVAHPYPFIIMHLKANSKNILDVNIPQTCIFNKNLPYDVLYNDKGHIKSLKDTQQLRLSKIYNFFLQSSKVRNTQKNEQCVACFENEEYLLLSDTDLFIICRKFKNDPFFKKIIYIRNRLDIIENNIAVDFDDSKDCEFRGHAVESFLGFKNDTEMREKYGQELYLKYVCEKIALFLNIEQNIRIRRARFIFAKTSNGKYYLTDIHNLYYENLTKALKKRELRLKREQQDRSNKIVISQEQYEKVKHRQNEPHIKALEKEMNHFFYNAAEKYKIVVNTSGVIESMKNEEAFDILFPQFRNKMGQTLSNMNVRSLKKKVLKTEQSYDYPKLLTKKTAPKQFLRTQTSIGRKPSISIRATRSYYSCTKQKAFV